MHINKGRLHAFRKQSPPDDVSPEQFCVSVAWDWLYQGSTPEAVGAELQEPLSCASFNAAAKVPSLSHTDAAVLHGSLAHKARQEATAKLKASAAAARPTTIGAATSAATADAASNRCDYLGDDRHALLGGLKPALASVVDRQQREAWAANFAQVHGKYELGSGAASRSSLPNGGYGGGGGGGLSGSGSRRRGAKASPNKPMPAAAADEDVPTASTNSTDATDAASATTSVTETSVVSASATATAAAAAVDSAALPSTTTTTTTATAAASMTLPADSEQANMEAQLLTRVLSLELYGTFPVDLNVPTAARLVASAPPLPKDDSHASDLRSPHRALPLQLEVDGDGSAVHAKKREMTPYANAPAALPLASAVEDPFSCDAYVCRSCARELAHAYLQV